MSAETPLIYKRFFVGSDYVVTLTLARPVPGKPACCVAEWEPAKPSRLTSDEMQDYRAGRDSLLADAAKALGMRFMVVEV